MKHAAKWVSVFFFVAALVLIGVRLFTGIVYDHDGPANYYVVKHMPSTFVQRQLQPNESARDHFTVVEEEEAPLLFEPAYLFLMQWCPAFVIFCLLLATGLMFMRSNRSLAEPVS